MQCNESRADDAPPADLSSSNPAPLGRKGAEAGLVVAWRQVEYHVSFPRVDY